MSKSLKLAIWPLLLVGSAAAGIRLELYPATPGAEAEARLAVMVEQRPAPLSHRKVWHSESSGTSFAEVAFARFAADGPVSVSLTSGRADLANASLRALGKELAVKGQGNRLEFALPGPGQYYLQLPGLAQSNSTFTVVFWLDDLRELETERASLKTLGAVDPTERGIGSDPALDQTKAIQALLDSGGTISFSAGVYRAGTLRLKSDTTLYLAPGAVLRTLEQEDALGSEFLAIEGAHNVKICGQGTFDANSLRSHRRHNAHHVNITSSQNVTLEDVLFEESNSWAIHIRKSDRFTARNVKILSGKDGFDPDASRDVLIDGAFIISADDAIAVKNRFPRDADGRTTERVTFRNSIVCSLKSALKIGTETQGPIRDVLFENCDIFDGERGVVLYGKDGGPIERAIWRNLRLFMRDWPKEKESGAVFHFIVDRRQGATPVRDCLIENVTANWLYRSEFAGLPDAPLEGIKMRNITVKADRPKRGKPALFEAKDYVRLPIEGLRVDWQGNEDKWAGVVSGKGITVSGLVELRKSGQASETK